MIFKSIAIVFLALCAIQAKASERIPRDNKAIAEFKRQQPCPSTGKARGACPGYVVDHIKPLCAGGPDRPENMQWQTVADAKAKDREERRQCKK